jgi:dihydrofolate reductase
MRLTVMNFLTLDGVMQSPGAPDEDLSDDFDLGGWLPPHFDEPVGAFIDEILQRAEAFLLGRRTYDILAAYWPYTDAPRGGPDFPLNRLAKYVATTRTDPLTWSGSQRLDGELATAVGDLKDRPGGELQVHGSGALAQSLMAEGLVDRYHLLVLPVVLGRGRRLFTEGVPPAGLRLVESRSFRDVAMLTYECAGGPAFGDLRGRYGNVHT